MVVQKGKDKLKKGWRRPTLKWMREICESGAAAADRFLKEKIDVTSRMSGYAAVSEAFTAFEDKVKMGQLVWRHELGDPRPEFRDAVEIAHKAAKLWREAIRFKTWTEGISEAEKPHLLEYRGVPLGRYDCRFSFAQAAMIAFLVEDDWNLDVTPEMGPFAGWKSADLLIRGFLDTGIVEGLIKRKRPREWTSYLEVALAAKLRWKNIARDFANYMDIICLSAKGKWAQALDRVMLADRYFKERESDRSYQWLCIDGAEGSNWVSVDFRLSTIMKCCFHERPESLEPLDSIHRWPW